MVARAICTMNDNDPIKKQHDEFSQLASEANTIHQAHIALRSNTDSVGRLKVLRDLEDFIKRSEKLILEAEAETQGATVSFEKNLILHKRATDDVTAICCQKINAQ